MGGTAALALSGVGMLGIGESSPASGGETYQHDTSQLDQQQKNDAEQRLSELAEVSAAHRAKVAAQGMNPLDGSSAAVLEGLEKKTLDQLEEQSAKYAHKRTELRQSFSDVQDENLTQRRGSGDLLLSDAPLLRELKNWG